jgi:glutathione S-transferase
MKLYYAPGACSLATHIVLEWIGKPYDLEKVGLHPKTDNLLAVNPAGAVPVIEDKGWLLTQNVAILNYLADVHPDAKLGGSNAKGRAEVNRWLGLANSELHPAFKPFFGATGYLEDPLAIDKSKDNAKATLLRLFKAVNDRLANRDWIAGERSIADPYLFVLIRWTRALKLDLPGLDNVQAFFQRMQQDAGVARVLKAEGLE